MRIAIIGGTGYIASHIVHDLIEAKHEILVIDNLLTGNEKNILQNSSNYKFIKSDFSSQEALNSLLEFQADVVFHFAALKAAGLSMLEPQKYSEQNLRKTFLLIERLASTQPSPCFIFSSSAAVYGEPEYLPIDENHPLRPINYYGFTKKAIEENLLWFCKLTKMNCAILRYFNAAGYDLRGRIQGVEKQPNNLIPIIMEVAMGKRKELEVFGDDYATQDGTCIRDYIHVNDLSKAHILSMEYIKKENKNLIINLGTGKGYTVMEVIRACEKVFGFKLNIKFANKRKGDSPCLVASAQLAMDTLNWSAIHSDIENIAMTTWKMYQKNF